MELRIAPELEEQLQKSAATQGRDAEELVQEALVRYLAEEAWQESGFTEGWSDEDRPDASAHIEEGFLQAERGELIDGDQARLEIQAMIDARRRQRQSKR
jgi:predicted transcriptional regulator